MISLWTEQAQSRRVDCSVSRTPRTTSSSSRPRLTPPRWSIPGGVVLALLLWQVTPVDAVTINSPTPPSITNTHDKGNGSRPQALLSAPDGGTITFDTSNSDPGYDARNWIIGLASGYLAIDKNVTLNGPPVSLLMLKRDRQGSGYSPLPLDYDYPVAIEGLAIGGGLALPTRWVILTAGGTAMLFLSLVLFYRNLQRPRGKRVRFGILWAGYRPICGKCYSRLRVLNDYSFQCPSCRVELGARGVNGRAISPREALVKIRLKEYW